MCYYYRNKCPCNRGRFIMFTYSKKPHDIKLQHTLQELARQFRKNPTIAEATIWRELRNRQLYRYKFRRQYPLFQFIVDFYCHERKLIIEIDGPIHAYQLERDTLKDKVFEKSGYRILRFTNRQVLYHLSVVKTCILGTLSSEERVIPR